MRLSVEQARNKNGLIDKYYVFDKDSLYFNTTALATFSLKNHAHQFVIGMMNNE